MENKLKLLILILFVTFLSSSGSYSQTISVRASINIIPPYSVYLSDYVSSTSNKLNINIIVNDPNPQELTTKLKFTIFGEGVTISTRPDFTPTPIRLNTGMNAITSADLVPYFDPANLNFQGLDKAQFIKSGRLKEGIYQFCVEVVEYSRGVRLSERACATAWLLLNNPPIWNLPGNNEIVKASNPQNLLFNWTPQHTGSPNSAFTAEYELTLVEVWPINRNPNDAINTQLPLYRATTTSNSLIYGPTEPQLIPGRKYAIRLKAYDKEGRDLFVNSGYSEVRVFTFGEECKPPVGLNAKVENFQRARISWVNQSSNTDFTVRYRPLGGSANAPWYSKRSIFTYAVLDSLKEGIKYEYNVRAGCESLISDYSLTDTFTLPVRPVNDFECKDENISTSLTNTAPKSNLRIGDRINIGGYDVELTEVKGSNGVFSGKGLIVIPFMNNIKVNTSFANITVNSDNIVTAGNINVDRASLQVIDSQTKDKIFETLTSVDQKFDDINKYLDKTNNIIKQVDNVISEVPKESQELMEKGKNLIEEGKQLIANGNTEAGKELIEQGKRQIQEGVKKAMAGNNSSTSQNSPLPSYDKLKEIVSSVIAKQKKSNDKNIEDKEKEVGSKNSEMQSSNSTIKATRDAVIIPDEGDNEGSDFLIVVNATNPKNKRPISNQEEESIKASPGRKRSLENRNKLIIAAIELRKYYFIKTILEEYTPQEALDILVGDINKDLETMAKEIFDNLLKGKKLDSVEDYVKSYIEKKVEERLQKLNIK